MWTEIISRVEKEKDFWKKIEERGGRYEGADSEFKEIRVQNTIYLYELVQRSGWPSISVHGEAINKAAFSIARCSIQYPEKMKYFAEKLAKSVGLGESNPVHLMTIKDCIKYYEGEPQECGMFLEWRENEGLYANVLSLDLANTKREALGLPSVEAAIASHLKELERQPGSKPKDINAHNEMHRNWAVSVGWRKI